MKRIAEETDNLLSNRIMKYFLFLVCVIFFATLSNAQCGSGSANGLEITSGMYSNVGGNGGVPLSMSASNPSQGLTNVGAGNLYQKKVSGSSITNGDLFNISLQYGPGDIMVRVVGDNNVLLYPAKKVAQNGNIAIHVCDASKLSGYSNVQFQFYGMSSTKISWSFGYYCKIIEHQVL